MGGGLGEPILCSSGLQWLIRTNGFGPTLVLFSHGQFHLLPVSMATGQLLYATSMLQSIYWLLSVWVCLMLGIAVFNSSVWIGMAWLLLWNTWYCCCCGLNDDAAAVWMLNGKAATGFGCMDLLLRSLAVWSCWCWLNTVWRCCCGLIGISQIKIQRIGLIKLLGWFFGLNKPHLHHSGLNQLPCWLTGLIQLSCGLIGLILFLCWLNGLNKLHNQPFGLNLLTYGLIGLILLLCWLNGPNKIQNQPFGLNVLICGLIGLILLICWLNGLNKLHNQHIGLNLLFCGLFGLILLAWWLNGLNLIQIQPFGLNQMICGLIGLLLLHCWLNGLNIIQNLSSGLNQLLWGLIGLILLILWLNGLNNILIQPFGLIQLVSGLIELNIFNIQLIGCCSWGLSAIVAYCSSCLDLYLQGAVLELINYWFCDAYFCGKLLWNADPATCWAELGCLLLWLKGCWLFLYCMTGLMVLAEWLLAEWLMAEWLLDVCGSVCMTISWAGCMATACLLHKLNGYCLSAGRLSTLAEWLISTHFWLYYFDLITEWVWMAVCWLAVCFGCLDGCQLAVCWLSAISCLAAGCLLSLPLSAQCPLVPEFTTPGQILVKAVWIGLGGLQLSYDVADMMLFNDAGYWMVKIEAAIWVDMGRLLMWSAYLDSCLGWAFDANQCNTPLGTVHSVNSGFTGGEQRMYDCCLGYVQLCSCWMDSVQMCRCRCGCYVWMWVMCRESTDFIYIFYDVYLIQVNSADRFRMVVNLRIGCLVSYFWSPKPVSGGVRGVCPPNVV